VFVPGKILKVRLIFANKATSWSSAAPCYAHRDRTRASTLCWFCLFFPYLNMQKTCWLWAPTTLKTHQKVWFSHIWLWIILSESCFYCKNKNLIKKLFLCFVSKPRVGPINNKHNNFKWGNIFAGICTLVLSLWLCLTLWVHSTVIIFLPSNSNIECEF
jgi:hypothetical protein